MKRKASWLKSALSWGVNLLKTWYMLRIKHQPEWGRADFGKSSS